MAIVGVTIRQKGLEKVQAYFSGMKKKAVDLTTPLKKGGLVMLRSVDKNFKIAGRPPWKPLKMSTLSWKIRNRYSPLPLTKSGDLRRGITFRADRNRLFVGTSNPYAAIHQFGGTTHPRVTQKMRRWAWREFYETDEDVYRGIALTKKSRLDVKIPKRPFLLFQNEDVERISRLIADHITLEGGS